MAIAEKGVAYSASLSPSGSNLALVWTLSSGSLPTGLVLSPNGVISGTPKVVGTFSFTVQVSDPKHPGLALTMKLSSTVQEVSVSTSALAQAEVGNSYSASLQATGGISHYTWSLTSGSLPAGLALGSNGSISGTPTKIGTSQFNVVATDAQSGAKSKSTSLSIKVSGPPLAIASPTLAHAEAGSSYSTKLQARGGTPAYAWSVISGNLPQGLSLSQTGTISGTPKVAGTSKFTLQVKDGSSPAQSQSAPVSLVVTAPALVITSSSLSAGQSGTAYSASLQASGGTPGYTWTVAAGKLPAGLSLSPTGVISGNPTAAGTANFTVQVADAGSPAQVETAQESIAVAAAPAPVATQVHTSGPAIYLYPTAPVAPRGTYQTVTAIVNGISNKTVTWTSDGGTIVGTNPCVVNEPCTVALYTTNTGTYHLTATSNANHAILATSTVTFTAAPVVRTDHPRFLTTSDMVPSLRAKAVPNNTMYEGIKTIASRYYSADSSIYNFSTWNGNQCVGGSGPNSDQSANYRENDTWWLTLVALFDPNVATRNQYGCAARDMYLNNVGYVVSGELSLLQGNRWADGAIEWAFTTDYLLGAGYLSSADQVVARQYFAKLAFQQINDIYNGSLAPIGNYNSIAQFVESDENSSTGMRAMGNNYTHARILELTAAALTFNDNTTDDPALANTCNASRYQVCPDGTAGSLHAYWSYVSGGMLYKDWANMEDGSVVQQAYGLSSTPMCNTLWHKPMSCLGSGRGGEPNEGTGYGSSTGKLRWALNAIHTAGYDDPLLYGPQMSMGSMSYWDLRLVADFTSLEGTSGAPNNKAMWTYLTDGDTLYNFTYPSNFSAESGMLASDALVGRTDRSAAIQWLLTNTAFGMASGTVGNCGSYCGFNTEIGNDYASSVALDMFIALPAEDPTTQNVASDPRPSLPTDWFEAGNQHIVARDNWGTNTNTVFSYYCTNTQIDHEHQHCGGFSVYSDGEYITKGRTEYNDYINEVSTARNQNVPVYSNNPLQTGCTFASGCYFADSTVLGGQLWHGYQAGLNTLYSSSLPTYVAAIADSTNSYNGGWGGFGQLNGINAASRSLIYLRGSNQVIYYDRGTSQSNAWDKANYLVSTGSPTFTGNTASWTTRSGQQKVYWTELEPTSTPQLDATYTDADAANDWEIYGRLKVDAGNVESARFMSVLQWGPATFSGSSATLITSSSGTPFEGALTGSSLVMFMRDWPSTFTTLTYPASGARTQYVCDLTPNTTYNISGAGTPATATTDSAGVLSFTASGAGAITISPAS